MGLVAIVVANGALRVATPSLDLSKLASWLMILALFVLILVALGRWITGRPVGLLIDERE